MSVRAVAAHLALPLAVAVCLAAWSVAHLACVSRDGTHYVAFARQLRQDPVFYLRAHRSQPGYSATMLLVHALLPPSWRADPVDAWLRIGQAVAACGYLACVPLVYLLARRLFDPRIARIAALLAALWPQAVQLAGDVLSDMPHLALYLAAVLIADAALRTRRVAHLFAAGAISGIAYLFRQEALAVPLAASAFVWLAWPKHSVRRRTCALATAMLMIGFVLPVLPCVVATGDLFHKKHPGELLFGQHAAAPGDDDGMPERDSCDHVDLHLRASEYCISEPRPSGSGAHPTPIRRLGCTRPCNPSAIPLRDQVDFTHGHRSLTVAAPKYGEKCGPSPPASASIRLAAQSPFAQLLYMLDGWARSGRYVFSTLVLIALLASGGTGASDFPGKRFVGRVSRPNAHRQGGTSRAEIVGSADPTYGSCPALRMHPGRTAAQPSTRRLIALLLLLHCLAVALRGVSFGVVSSRYMMIPASLTLPWAGAGLCIVIDALMRRRPSARASAPPAAAWLVVAAITLPYALKPINADDAYLREAGAFLRAAARSGDSVLAEHRACQTIYYSDLPWNQWPDEAWPLETILARQSQTAARWYVHFDGARGDAKQDDAVVAAILAHPRWPNAKLAYETRPRGRKVRIIRLGP